MKKIFKISLLLLLTVNLQAQIEQVIVEKYYISDTRDAEDTTGGKLTPGSVTYRIFIDLAEGSYLNKLYGDANHPLKISSTLPVFNNSDRGERFGYLIRDNSIDENTVALDSWLTLGSATKKHAGILKNKDTDGSIIGGAHHEEGLLSNNNPDIGIPLVNADGLIPLDSIRNYVSYGIDESSIFGEAAITELISYNAFIRSSNITGPTSDNNILVAQITTLGEISFELNVEVFIENDPLTDLDDKTICYVASGDTLLKNEIVSKWLKYPFKSGCINPDYLEFDPMAVIDNNTCKTPIILGCMDPLACNFDEQANYSVKELCCYGPDQCDGRDLDIVCPDYFKRVKQGDIIDIVIYPNPVNDYLEFEMNTNGNTQAHYSICDIYGKVVMENQLGTIQYNTKCRVDLSGLTSGLYILRTFSTQNTITKSFMKL